LTEGRKRSHDNNKKIKERRKALLLEIKKDGCIICQEKRPSVLDFHHLDDKDKGIAQLPTVQQICREIGKCVVICCKCHRLYHAGEIELPSDVKPIDASKYDSKDLRCNRFHFLSPSAKVTGG
jgi:hypothetical protein